MARLLALVLVLFATLPTQAWGRIADACGQSDHCRCRRDADLDETLARRPDCCETPCSSELAPCPAAPLRSDAAIAIAPAELLLPPGQLALRSLVLDEPRARPRGPPPRWFGRVRHRLI